MREKVEKLMRAEYPDYDELSGELQVKIYNRIYQRLWARENPDKKRKNNRKSFVKNREKYRKLAKIWKEHNRETYLMKMRKYGEKVRREKGIKPRNKAPDTIYCECGGHYRPKNKYKHNKSKRHIKMENAKKKLEIKSCVDINDNPEKT
tara:strand:+ start:1852 stop:2298 length:447 start_codon:yes stop_codon:yes gene_type:complete